MRRSVCAFVVVICKSYPLTVLSSTEMSVCILGVITRSIPLCLSYKKEEFLVTLEQHPLPRARTFHSVAGAFFVQTAPAHDMDVHGGAGGRGTTLGIFIH